MPTLERAIEIAAIAHDGQTDKAGEPYITHPLRVMLPFIRAGDERRAIVAILHDVIEDGAWSAADLAQEGFSPEVVEAIDALSGRPEEDYVAFVQRAAANELARPVKLADLRDNLAETRMARLSEEKRQKLLLKYEGALEALGAS
jgi:(p)ppGpp synthase/HD superfamily hydrolase